MYQERLEEIVSIMHDIQKEVDYKKITPEEGIRQAYLEFELEMPEKCEQCKKLSNNLTTIDYKGNVIFLHEECRETFEEDNNI